MAAPFSSEGSGEEVKEEEVEGVEAEAEVEGVDEEEFRLIFSCCAMFFNSFLISLSTWAWVRLAPWSPWPPPRVRMGTTTAAAPSPTIRHPPTTFSAARVAVSRKGK